MPSFPSLVVELRPSPTLLLGGGLSHVLAGTAVVVASIPLWIKVGIMVGIGLTLTRFGWRYLNRDGRGFIARIELLDGRWRIETGDGQLHRAQVTCGYAHPQIIILKFRMDTGWSWGLTLLPDSADPDSQRQLRVWLRTRRVEPEPP